MTEATSQAPLLARVSEAATALAFSEDQIRKFIAQGVLPEVRVGKSVRTTWAAIHSLAQQAGSAA